MSQKSHVYVKPYSWCLYVAYRMYTPLVCCVLSVYVIEMFHFCCQWSWRYLVWSLEPEHRMWPNGCQARLQIIPSWAISIPPTSFSTLTQSTTMKWEPVTPVTVQHTKPLQIQHHYPACQKSREPSEPPLANRPSWTGCQATAEDKRTQRNPGAFHFQDSECVRYQLLTRRLLLVSSEHL